jgi:hypothetical protein
MASHPVEDPALLPGDRGEAREVRAHGPLFDGKPKGTDVEQNNLGDCFFLSSLASLAERRPEEVRAAIHARPDGTFAVRLFHEDHTTGTLAPREVVVDARIPEEHGAPIYGTTMDGHGLWVSLFEKAFAVLRGGYSRIDGGDARAAIEALTGRPARTTKLEHAHPDAIWEALEHAIASREITLASTYSDEDARATLARRHARGEPTAHVADPFAFTYARRGLVEAHEYSVWGLSGAGDHRAVHLRNPWGELEPKGDGDGKDDGMFSMPFDEVMLLFADVTIGG